MPGPIPLTDLDATIALPKQRRFAILVSMVLIGVYWLQFSVKDFQLAGINLGSAHIDRLPYAIWLVWFWAQLRYLQRVYALFQEIKRDVIADVDAEDLRLAHVAAKRRAKKIAVDRRDKWTTPKSSEPIVTVVSILPSRHETVAGDVVNTIYFHSDDDGGRTYPSVALSYYFLNDKSEIQSGTDNFGLKMSRTKSNLQRIRSWANGIARLPAASEHLTPIVLAIIAIAAALFSDPISDADRCIAFSLMMRPGTA